MLKLKSSKAFKVNFRFINMTIRLLDPSHYADVIPNIQNLPQFHFLYPLIKFEGEGLNSGTNLIIYEYSQTVHDKEKKFYLAFKYHKHSNVIVIGNSSYLCGKFEGNAMAELFPVIKDRLLAESLFETVLPEASEKEVCNCMVWKNKFLNDYSFSA